MKTESMTAKEFIDEKAKIAKKRGSKYRNVKTVVDGITFDSKKEAKRYQELKLMEKAGEIMNLKLQEKFSLTVHHHIENVINKFIHICDYRADFSYLQNGKAIIEDVKSEVTRKNPVYRIKKKLMKAIYGIDIVEA